MAISPLSRIRHATFGIGLGALAFAASPSQGQVPAGYAGKPWHDSIQVIPGRIQPEKYDEGASGITWFDTGPHIGSYTARNSGVDLDAVHAGDPNVPGSTVKIVPGDIYWGWLENNEWLKMTVNVKEAGAYSIHAMVGTAMTGTSFKVDALQGTDSVSSGTLVLPFTGSCPVECYHYWFYAKDAGTINLKAGVQVLRMQIVKSGYNIEYIDLEKAGSSGIKAGSRVAPGAAGLGRDARPGKTPVDAAGRKPVAGSLRQSQAERFYR
ncbi:MAG: carbohydrate-binding protein [Fibrobacteres bacterium]|nr:carbohydrate-binding protein [Fibrobacterota bacterium]